MKYISKLIDWRSILQFSVKEQWAIMMVPWAFVSETAEITLILKKNHKGNL